MEIALPVWAVSGTVDSRQLRETLIGLLAKKSAKRGEFKLASGRVSSLYIDARMTTMSPEGLSVIGPLALEAMRTAGWNVDSVGGLTLGADPVAYAISYASSFGKSPLRAFTVRKELKQHGTGKIIEGPFLAGDRVAVIEDVITTGGSALRAVAALRDAGAQIVGVLGLVDREEGGRNAIEEAGYQVLALSTASEIMEKIAAT